MEDEKLQELAERLDKVIEHVKSKLPEAKRDTEENFYLGEIAGMELARDMIKDEIQRLVRKHNT